MYVGFGLFWLEYNLIFPHEKPALSFKDFLFFHQGLVILVITEWLFHGFKKVGQHSSF